MVTRSIRALTIGLTATTALAVSFAAPTSAQAATDSFFTYSGPTPLSSYKPGAVLKSRTVPYSVLGVPTPLDATQILFRSTDAQGRPIAAVTSVVKPVVGAKTNQVVAYQSFYDSLNPEHGPSRAIAGNVSFGGAIASAETAFIAPFLLKGYPVVIADTQGPTADFAAGPEYGHVTLDSLRAVSNSSATLGISATAKVGMFGYSGGAIATNWASALAPSYAPDVNSRLVGAAEGGLLVKPDRNLNYIGGSTVWAGVAAMAITGVARAYNINFDPYLNDYGRSVIAKMQKASIANVLAQYPGLTWAKMVKPQYANPASVPEFVAAVNKVNLGLAPNPTVPMYIGQGAAGWQEGTSGTKAGIGAGDGVMVAADVRSLARKYCNSGTIVKYQQYNLTSHFSTMVLWAPSGVSWLVDRFAGKAAPNNCGSIPAGNPLDALKPV